MRTSRAARATALALVLALSAAACDGDDAPDDGATETPSDDAGGGDAPDEGSGDDSSVAPPEEPEEPEEPETPPAESEVVVEGLDAPVSAAEVRVGEIIVEFDGEVTDDGTVLTLEEPILFDFDSSTLRSGSREALDEIAEVLAFYEEAPVEVIGHTDDVGSADYNQQLSADRAEAVATGLRDRGISSGRLSSEGRGFDDPAVPNDSDDNRAINRRVEVLIVGVTPPEGDG